MTVSELIEELKGLPQDIPVMAHFSPGSSDLYLDDVDGAEFRESKGDNPAFVVVY